MVSIGDFFQRHPVRDDGFGTDAATLNVVDQFGQVALHGGLVSPDRDAFFITLPMGTRLSVGPYTPTTDTVPPFLTELMAQHRSQPSLQQGFATGDGLQHIATGFGTHGIDAYIGTYPVDKFFDEYYRVIHLTEVKYFALGIVPHEFKTIIHLIDHDNPPGTEEPRTFGRHNAHRPRAKNHHGVARLDAAHFCRLIPRWKHVGQQNGIVRVHIGGDHRRAKIGVGHPPVFSLTTVEAARSMRITKNSTGFVAVAIQALLAKNTLATGYIEGHQHLITRLYFVYCQTHLFDDTDKLMAECGAYAGVGYVAVVEVQVGATDAGAGYAHNGIFGVLQFGIRFLVNPDPPGTPVIHS